jgi:acyl-CoA thioesterase-1
MSILSSLRRAGAVVALAALIVGCGAPESNGSAESSSNPAGSAEDDVAADRRVVMFLGTSLTDGYGLEREQAYPALIQQKIDSAGLPFEVVNAGLSGERSAGALQRVRGWLLKQPFDVLVIETGANDMLNGLPTAELRSNIQGIIDTVRAAKPNTRIVLVGMLAAPNLGRTYVDRFNRVYPDLAEENDVPLVPFLLEGVATERDLNIADAIHPNAQGHGILAGTVWKALEPVLREGDTRQRGG